MLVAPHKKRDQFLFGLTLRPMPRRGMRVTCSVPSDGPADPSFTTSNNRLTPALVPTSATIGRFVNL